MQKKVNRVSSQTGKIQKCEANVIHATRRRKATNNVKDQIE